MRVGLMTREYPPNVYGGAGVHVEYLSLELAKKIEVEVHCWGTQREDEGNLHVWGDEPPAQITEGTKEKFKAAVDAFALNLSQMKMLGAIDIGAYAYLVCVHGRVPGEEAVWRAVRADDALAGAAAGMEGGAAWVGLCVELVDGAGRRSWTLMRLLRCRTGPRRTSWRRIRMSIRRRFM